MDKNEAIKILRKGYPDINKYAASELEAYEYDIETYNEAVGYAISRLEEGRWNFIHTEADLPKESDWYFATIVGTLGNTYTYCVFYSATNKNFEFAEKVIAWKPMPKPYESEDK